MTEYDKKKTAPVKLQTGLSIREEQRLSAIDKCAEILSRERRTELMLAGDPRLRATWWVDYMMEEPHYPSERPSHTSQGGLIDAYINRVTHCLGKYLRFGDEEQRYILAAREDNIWWRGDEIGSFRIVVGNTIVWHDLEDEGKDALKAETASKARNFVRPLVSRGDASPGIVSNVGQERDRQLDALYRAMTPEDQAKYDERASVP